MAQARFGWSDSLVDQRAAKTDRQLRHRDHSFHHLHLFALLPAEVAIVAQDEEGAEVRAAHEGTSGATEGNEVNRRAHERVADGATAFDEGSEPAGRLFASADSDAVSFCALQRDYYLDRFSPGNVPLDSRFVRTRALHLRVPSHPSGHVLRFDDRASVTNARAFRRSAATKDDGDRHAALHALHFMERTVRTAALLVGWQYRRLHSADAD